jgi:hypothetical protein
LSRGEITASGKRGVLFSPLVWVAPATRKAERPFHGSQQVEPTGGHVVAEVVEVDHDLEQVGDLHRASLRVCDEMIAVGIEQTLVNRCEIAGPLAPGDELQEPAYAVEELAEAGWRQAGAVARNVEVEPCVEELPQGPLEPWIGDAVEMRGDMADAGVGPEHGRRQVPGAVLEAGQCRSLEAPAQRRALQDRPAGKRMRSYRRNELEGRGPGHARASSGR